MHWTVPLIIFVPTIIVMLVLGFIHGVGVWAVGVDRGRLPDLDAD